MELSKFGKKFSGQSGIARARWRTRSRRSMKTPDMLFMGGGNPGRIPQVEELFKPRPEALAGRPC